MKKYSLHILVVLISVLWYGCCPVVVTDVTETIKTEARVITPSIIKDSLKAKYDTLFVHGEKVIKKDTIIQVKYFPKLEKFYIKVKPDSIRVIDTTTVIKRETKIIEKPSIWDELKFVFIGAIVILLLVLFLRRK